MQAGKKSKDHIRASSWDLSRVSMTSPTSIDVRWTPWWPRELTRGRRWENTLLPPNGVVIWKHDWWVYKCLAPSCYFTADWISDVVTDKKTQNENLSSLSPVRWFIKIDCESHWKNLTDGSVVLRRLIKFGTGLVSSLPYYIFLFTPQTLSKQLASFGQRDWTTKYFDWNLMLFGSMLNYIFFPHIGGAGGC